MASWALSSAAQPEKAFLFCACPGSPRCIAHFRALQFLCNTALLNAMWCAEDLHNLLTRARVPGPGANVSRLLPLYKNNARWLPECSMHFKSEAAGEPTAPLDLPLYSGNMGDSGGRRS